MDKPAAKPAVKTAAKPATKKITQTSSKMIMRVEGFDGQIELLPDRVVIYRAGLWLALTYGFNFKREIPLNAISEIAFKDATTIFPGEIEFLRAGGEAPVMQTGKKNKKPVNKNKVKFSKKMNPDFEALKEKAFELMQNSHGSRQ